MFIMNIEVLGKQHALNGETAILAIHRFETSSPNINLSPRTLIEIIPITFNPEDISGIRASVTCNNSIVTIEGIDYVHLQAFANSSPTMAYLRISGASKNSTVNGFTIKRLDSEHGNLLLANSEVDEVNIGIEDHFEFIRNEIEELSTIEWTDIRDSDVKGMRIYAPHGSLIINNSRVGKLSIDNNSADINILQIIFGSIIDRLSFASKVLTSFMLMNSSISSLEFFSKSVVQKLDFQHHTISRVYNCLETSITTKDKEAWKMIMESARENYDASAYSEAGYQYMKCNRKGEKGLGQRLAFWLFEISCGYGFKPGRTVLCGITLWLIFAVIFTLLTLFGPYGITSNQKMAPIEIILNSLYYSVITFTTTGYGDILPQGVSKLFAGLEAVSGSTVSALFIFSLTKRYGSLK